MEHSAQTDRVLIVVPTLNEVDWIETVMDTLLEDAPRDTRLVVADGGSTDGTREVVRRYAARNETVTLMHNDARIQSAGINRAVQTEARDADFLLRADAHAAYPPGYCRVLLDEIRATDSASVTVAMRTVPKGGFSTGVAAAQNSFLGTGGSAHRTGAGVNRFVEHGHHAIMRVDAFSDVGGYDAGQSHNEDAELDHRLRKAGHRIWLTGRTDLEYVPRRTPEALFRQYFAYGRGRAMTVEKHRVRLRLRQMAPLAVAPAVFQALIGLILSPLAVEWLLLGLPALLWATICLVYGAIAALRAGDPAVALAGPAAMVMHFAWSTGFLTHRVRSALASGSVRARLGGKAARRPE